MTKSGLAAVMRNDSGQVTSTGKLHPQVTSAINNLQLSGGPFGPVITRVSIGLRSPPVISEIRYPPLRRPCTPPLGGYCPPAKGAPQALSQYFCRYIQVKTLLNHTLSPGSISYKRPPNLIYKIQIFFLSLFFFESIINQYRNKINKLIKKLIYYLIQL